MERVVCTCEHLNVEAGEIGYIISDEAEYTTKIKWNNGVIETLQYDFWKVLPKRNKNIYLVKFGYFTRVLLNKKEANETYTSYKNKYENAEIITKKIV